LINIKINLNSAIQKMKIFLEFDVKNYKPGFYYLMVVGKDFVTTKQIVKIQ